MASSNTEPVGKPADIPGGDFEGCVAFFEDDPNVDDPEALCAFLEREGKEALADPNANELLTGLGVEFVSPVDAPAQSSEWLIAKDATDKRGDTHRWKAEAPLYVSKSDPDREAKEDGEKQIAFAPVLVPGEVDKHGDVVPAYEIEKAAHGYLANHRKVDSDHDLIDGKGTPVESWTLKEATSFTKPDGEESREYPVGTWILGIKFDDETWSRLKSGELTGLSMYGGARPIDLDALRDALGIETTKRKGESSDTDTPQMGDDNDTPDEDGESTVAKQVDASMVSTFLETFGDKVDNGLPVDATVEDFVMRLIEDGDVEETEITGLSVLLNGGGGGPDEEPEGPPEPEADEDPDPNEVEMSKSENGGEDATPDGDSTEPEADDGGGDGADTGSVLPDDTPDWAKALSKDVRSSVDDVRGDVDELADRVDDLEKEVNDESLNPRIEDDGDFEKRFKSYLGIDDDADPDVVRKALREQVSKAAEDGDLSEDYSGLFEDEDTEVAKGAGRTADANIRMAPSEGGD